MSVSSAWRLLRSEDWRANARVMNPSIGSGRGVVATVETTAVDHAPRELEAARVAIASLLAVMTDEQVRSVETALSAIGPMSDMAPAALDELRSAQSRRRTAAGEDEMLRALEVRLATREQHR